MQSALSIKTLESIKNQWNSGKKQLHPEHKISPDKEIL